MIGKLLELVSLLPDACLDRVRVTDVLERELKLCLHVGPPQTLAWRSSQKARRRCAIGALIPIMAAGTNRRQRAIGHG
jgi:hypothetical protein